jgi:hypothetical protein
MASQSDIEIAVLQICNKLGMDAKLPSDNMVIQAWRELAHDRQSKGSIAGRLYKEKDCASSVIEGVKAFYKERRRKEKYNDFNCDT